MSQKFNIQTIGDKPFIYDRFRKKFVSLSPEEWVRQHFLEYLHDKKKYPLSMIAVEKQIKIGNLNKRFDILIYKAGKPWMLVECKSESTVLNDAVLRQIQAYNSLLKVEYLAVSNGKSMFCFNIKMHEWMRDVPDWT